MRTIVIAITMLFLFTGCESAHDQLVKKLEAQIKNTISTDWKESGIPLGSLLAARVYCQHEQGLSGCAEVASRLRDISISYASCKTDQRSTLCRAMLKILNEDMILSILPKPAALTLPEYPWYWSLPTDALESQASKFNYRSEVAGWWWQARHKYVLSCIALLIISITAWKWRCNKKRKIEEFVRQSAAHIEQQRVKLLREEQEKLKKLENESLAEIFLDATIHDAAVDNTAMHNMTIEEQNRIDAEEILAKNIKMEADAKLTIEKEETAKLLSSIFALTENIQRQNRAADNESALTGQKTEGSEYD